MEVGEAREQTLLFQENHHSLPNFSDGSVDARESLFCVHRFATRLLSNNGIGESKCCEGRRQFVQQHLLAFGVQHETVVRPSLKISQCWNAQEGAG